MKLLTLTLFDFQACYWPRPSLLCKYYCHATDIAVADTMFKAFGVRELKK